MVTERWSAAREFLSDENEDVEARPGDEDASKAEQLVEVLKTVLQDRIQQRTVEQIVDVPVPQVLKELAEVFKSFLPVTGFNSVRWSSASETPATSLAEMIVEVPVIQTPERTQQVVNTSVQHIVDTVEVQKPTIQKKINQVTPSTSRFHKSVTSPSWRRDRFFP